MANILLILYTVVTAIIIPFKYLYQLGMDIETKNNTPAAFPAAVGTKGC